MSSQVASIKTPNTSAKPTTRRNVGWVLAGNLIYAATQGGVLIALTRLGSAEIVGQFSLGLAVCAPIITFANCQLRSVQAVDAVDEYRTGDYFGFRIVTTALAFVAILLVSLLSRYSIDLVFIILAVAVAKSFEAFSDILFGYMQQKERMNRIGKSLIIEGILTFVAVGIVVYLTHSAFWAAAVMALLWGLQLLLYDLPSAIMAARASQDAPARQVLTPRFNLSAMRKILIASLPLGIAGSINSLTTNIPRYFINSWVGAGQLGIFVNSAYLLTVSSIIGTSVSVALSPRLAQYYQLGKYPAFRRLRGQMLLIGIGIGVCGIVGAVLLGEPLLRLVFGQEYAENVDVLIILAVAVALNYSWIFLGTAFKAMRIFWTQLPVQIISLIAILIFSAILVPQYGIHGAAWALFLQNMVNLVSNLILAVFISRRHKMPSPLPEPVLEEPPV